MREAVPREMQQVDAEADEMIGRLALKPFGLLGDRADQAFADCHACDMDGFLRQTARGEKF